MKPLVNQLMEEVCIKISSEHQESVISVEKKEISSVAVPLEERGFYLREGLGNYRKN